MYHNPKKPGKLFKTKKEALAITVAKVVKDEPKKDK